MLGDQKPAYGRLLFGFFAEVRKPTRKNPLNNMDSFDKMIELPVHEFVRTTVMNIDMILCEDGYKISYF